MLGSYELIDRRSLPLWLKGFHLQMYVPDLKTTAPPEVWLRQQINTDLSAVKDEDKRCSVTCNRRLQDIVQAMSNLRTNIKTCLIPLKFEPWIGTGTVEVDATEAHKVQPVEVQRGEKRSILAHFTTCKADLTPAHSHLNTRQAYLCLELVLWWQTGVDFSYKLTSCLLKDLCSNCNSYTAL